MSEARAVVTETDRLFRELVLCLGGILAVHEVDDALVWQITKSFDRIYQRTRQRLLALEASGDHEVPTRRVAPHPAVEELLARIGQ